MDQGAVRVALAALVLLVLPACALSKEARLRNTLASQTTGIIRLPQGEVEVSSELTLAPGAHDLEIVGNETRLKAAANFKGRAILVLENAQRIHLHYLEIDGNRQILAGPLEMAPPENVFRVWYPDNGVLVNNVAGLQIERMHLANVVNFPILVSQSSNVRVWGSTVENSGSKNARGRNNLSGGILFEEGSSNFEVTARCSRAAAWPASSNLPERTARASDRSIAARDRSARSSSASTTVTSTPDRAQTSAIPDPIRPPPITPTRMAPEPSGPATRGAHGARRLRPAFLRRRGG